ncbi:MAG TPA: response regulator transcription factor [Candidatus Limnocylindrales bacterium]|nr:response regulator transcription factor [Candidatus Limnocylindrales bacterium]
MRARVLLADDHQVLTDGLTKLLGQYYDVVATAANGHELISLARQHNPDVIVTDISMPLLNGMDAIRVLKKSGIKSKVLVLTMHSDAALAVEAFRAGASAYVLKHAAGDEIRQAVDTLLRGRVYLSTSFPIDLVTLLADAARHPSQEGPSLTRRQREVLQLVAEGKTMKEVAGLLSISTRTAESYKYEIMRVLGVHTNAELVQYAIRIGMITVAPLHPAA